MINLHFCVYNTFIYYKRMLLIFHFTYKYTAYLIIDEESPFDFLKLSYFLLFLESFGSRTNNPRNNQEF